MSTVEIVRASLSTNPRAVERAMVLLYACQTADEQATATTRVTNGRGFTSYDARKGSYYARWIIGCKPNEAEAQTAARLRDYLTHGFREGINRPLTGRFLQDARHRSMKYAGQLLRIAEAMRAAKPAPAPAPPALPERTETEIGPFRIVTIPAPDGEFMNVAIREGSAWVRPQTDVRFMLCEWAEHFEQGDYPIASLTPEEVAALETDVSECVKASEAVRQG